MRRSGGHDGLRRPRDTRLHCAEYASSHCAQTSVDSDQLHLASVDAAEWAERVQQWVSRLVLPFWEREGRAVFASRIVVLD